ncbi:MAG: type II toxin-antitoxin system ParD family antitoxin [Rhizobium sp.]|nr:type II toxin-antitoxin system ParD family antitoxin [Rhizobium sp.]
MSRTTSVTLGDHFASFTNEQLGAGRYGRERGRAGGAVAEERRSRSRPSRMRLIEGEQSGEPRPLISKRFTRKRAVKRQMEALALSPAARPTSIKSGTTRPTGAQTSRHHTDDIRTTCMRLASGLRRGVPWMFDQAFEAACCSPSSYYRNHAKSDQNHAHPASEQDAMPKSSS